MSIWLVVCKHLVEGLNEWNEVGDPLEGYVCNGCFSRVENLKADDLEPLALESIAMLRTRN